MTRPLKRSPTPDPLGTATLTPSSASDRLATIAAPSRHVGSSLDPGRMRGSSSSAPTGRKDHAGLRPRPAARARRAPPGRASLGPGWRLRPLNEWYTILGEIVAARHGSWKATSNTHSSPAYSARTRSLSSTSQSGFPYGASCAGDCEEAIDLTFLPGSRSGFNLRTLTLVWDYRRRTREQIVSRVERNRRGRQVIVLRRPRDVSALIDDLAARLPAHPPGNQRVRASTMGHSTRGHTR